MTMRGIRLGRVGLVVMLISLTALEVATINDASEISILVSVLSAIIGLALFVTAPRDNNHD